MTRRALILLFAVAGCASGGARVSPGTAMLDPSSIAAAFSEVCVATGARHAAMADVLDRDGWVFSPATGLYINGAYDISFKPQLDSGAEACSMVARTDTAGGVAAVISGAGAASSLSVTSAPLDVRGGDYVRAVAVPS